MDRYIYLQLFVFIASTVTVFINGYLMLLEKDKLDFKELTKKEKTYTISLVYNEIYLGIFVIYTFIYFLYHSIMFCYTNKKIELTFSFWKAIYLFSGIISHIYSAYVLFFHPGYIDENIQTININFTVNMFVSLFGVFVTNLINSYKRKDHYVDPLL
jgi:hypothetical protein